MSARTCPSRRRQWFRTRQNWSAGFRAEDVLADAIEVAADLQGGGADRAAVVDRGAEYAALDKSADAVAADDKPGEERIRAGSRQLGVVALRGIEIERARAALLGANEKRIDVQYAGPAADISAAGVGGSTEVGRADDDAVGDGIAAALNEGGDCACVLADEFAVSDEKRRTAHRHRQETTAQDVSAAARRTDLQSLRDNVRTAALDESAAGVAEPDEFEAVERADDRERAAAQRVCGSSDLQDTDRVRAAGLRKWTGYELGAVRRGQRAAGKRVASGHGQGRLSADDGVDAIFLNDTAAGKNGFLAGTQIGTGEDVGAGEIGYLDLRCPAYRPARREISGVGRAGLAVARGPLRHPIVGVADITALPDKDGHLSPPAPYSPPSVALGSPLATAARRHVRRKTAAAFDARDTQLLQSTIEVWMPADGQPAAVRPARDFRHIRVGGSRKSYISCQAGGSGRGAADR
jgi:hypothetical protein